ncbi:MAG: hypothetical protein U0411_06320 [Thermodesulfovibrionales bacterium]
MSPVELFNGRIFEAWSTSAVDKDKARVRYDAPPELRDPTPRRTGRSDSSVQRQLQAR